MASSFLSVTYKTVIVNILISKILFIVGYGEALSKICMNRICNLSWAKTSFFSTVYSIMGVLIGERISGFRPTFLQILNKKHFQTSINNS